MADLVRYAVAERHGHTKRFTLRVFGDDPVVYTSAGCFTLRGDEYRPVSRQTDVRIISVHPTMQEAVSKICLN